MKNYVVTACIVVFAISLPAQASSLEDECVAVSAAWGSTGDIASQCSCIAEAAAGDDDVIAELMTFGDTYSNDAEAYESASSQTKAVMDSCSVES